MSKTGAWSDFWKRLHKSLVEKLLWPVGAKGVTIELGSGYDMNVEQQINKEKLMKACQACLDDPEYIQKPDGSTACNLALKRIAGEMGCVIKGMANEIIGSFKKNPDWTKDSGERAFQHAEKGGFAVAARKEVPHGHVCAVTSLPMLYSGSLQKYVPVVCHIGRAPNGFKKATEAFPVADYNNVNYYLWKIEDV